MAEGLLKIMLPPAMQGRINVRSAGTHALEGRRAARWAILVMKTLGVDLSAHRARVLTKKMVMGSDFILVMEQAHAERVERMDPAAGHKIYLLGEFSSDQTMKEIPDPYGELLFAYRACALIIRDCINSLIAQLEKKLKID